MKDLEQEIKYQQYLTSKLSKYLTSFDYADKILTIFLTVFSGINIFARVEEEKQLLGLITSVFSLLFCLSSGVVKKLQQDTKTRKKKHNKLLSVCSYHVTYAFQSESTLSSCLNVKELLVRSRREI